MNREVHARFWERAEVQFFRATRQSTVKKPRLIRINGLLAGLSKSIGSTFVTTNVELDPREEI